MQVILSERVRTILQTLSLDERERVHAWIGYFRNWEQDSFVRAKSVTLDVQGETVYMFRTSSELRIFFTVNETEKIVHVLDLATKETILASGSMTAGGT